ncbi:hypothetical protein D3C76_1558970 [compost metagenome]
MQVFGGAGVYIARDVEVVVVVGNLGQWYQASVFGYFVLLSKGVDDFVNVLLPQAVFIAIFNEAFTGIQHKDAFAAVGVLFIQHDDAGWDACAVKQVGR